MVQDEGSSSVTSSPLQCFSLMSLSPAGGGGGGGSPYTPWLRDLKSDERGLWLIHLLLNCANHVAAGSLDHANAFLDHISVLASPDGDAMQRIASYFTEALARRILRSWPGLYRALTSTAGVGRPAAEAAQARGHFADLCPFLRLAFLASNQAIVEAMDGEKMVHVVDLNGTDPAQWVALLQSLSSRPDGPPHLRITVVNEQRELLAHMAAVLSDEAEKLDIPFQFNPVIARLETLDVESLRVKTGEALAISSTLQLHCLLACDDAEPSPKRSNISLPMPGGGTLGELLEKDHHHHHHCAPLDGFLASLWGLSPKVMIVTEQESNHNGATMNERFVEALNFYAALFDCLESTVGRRSAERARVEKMLLGEEIKNIVACEGAERRERHERLEWWAARMEGAGFGRVPLSYYALLQARRLLQGSIGCESYKVREEKGCFFLCWHDRPLFSVSAWRCRRYD